MTLPIHATITIGEQEVIPGPARQYWRVNHDKPLWRFNLPEVFRLEPDHHVVMTEPLQWLWRKMNPSISDVKYRALYDNHLAFTNGSGMPDGADYINEIDLGNKDPRFDQARICGGAIVSGRVDGSRLWLDAIDVRKPLPTATQVMATPHLFYEAVNIAQDQNKQPVIHRLKGLWGVPVWMPLLVATDAWLPIAPIPEDNWPGLTKLPLGAPLPSPYLYP